MSEIIKSKPLSTEGRDRWESIFKKTPKGPLYTVVESVGCTSNTFTVNGKDQLTKQETLDFINHLFTQYKKGLDTGECCLVDVVRLFPCDNYKLDDNEDLCPSIATTTWTFE